MLKQLSPTPRTWLRVAVPLGCLVAGLGLGFLIFASSELDDGDEPVNTTPVVAEGAAGLTVKEMPVAVQRAREVSQVSIEHEFAGVIQPRRSSELSFEQPGMVVELQVQEGQAVRPDQVLARLDIRNLEAELERLQFLLAAAESRMLELENGPRAETVKAARANWTAAQASLEKARVDLERREKLWKQQAISAEEFARARSEFEVSQANCDAAQQRFDELDRGTRSEIKGSQKAVINQIKANIENQKIAIEKSYLRAPYAGIVSLRYIDEGTAVTPSTPVFRIVEPDVEAQIGVAPDWVAALQPATAENPWPHRVTVGGTCYAARVDRLLPEVDPSTRTQTLVFRLDAKLQPQTFANLELALPEQFTRSDNLALPQTPTAYQTQLSPGQVARVRLEQQMDQSGIWVPTECLVPAPRGLWSVLVAEQHEGQWRVGRRDVEEVLRAGSNQTLVRGTLQSGDLLIATGVHKVTRGQRIKPLFPESSDSPGTRSAQTPANSQ